MTERGAVSGMDPAELWRQWMESGSRMWSEGLRGGQADPFGLRLSARSASPTLVGTLGLLALACQHARFAGLSAR